MNQKQAIKDLEGWGMFDEIHGEYHIKPLNDYRDHESDKNCWCGPDRDKEHPCIIVHHSMDRREEYEEGRKLS